MNKDIVVKRSEMLPGTKGEYLRVYYDDSGKEKFTNVFDQALWNLFGDGLAVRLHLEKEGNWFNVKGAEAISNVFKQEAVKNVTAQMSDGKNRSFALSYAKDWCIAQLSQGVKLTIYDVVVGAKIFESYLDTGVVTTKKEPIEKKEVP